jgi:hypothetical protein
MKTAQIYFLMAGIAILGISCHRSNTVPVRKADLELEKQRVDQVVHNAICWAMTKDTVTLYNTFVPDSTLFIFSPDSASTLTGIKAIHDLADQVWLTDRFKALECNIRDLRIQFSQHGDVAWYSCYLDDICEWDGKKAGWRNVRWTGVLEKRQGKWLIMQMHFSFPEERFTKLMR